MSGELKIVASADLHGLGNNDSAPIIHAVHWTLPVLESLPCLLLAGALMLERRAKRGNCWLLLALSGGFFLVWALARIMVFAPTDLLEVAEPVFQALVYGFAMMWLLSGRLAGPAGKLPLKALEFMGTTSALALLALIDFNNQQTVLPAGMGLLFLWVGTSTGLAVAPRFCRHRLNFMTFFVSVTVAWFATFFAFFAILTLLSSTPWRLDISFAIAAVLAGVLALVLAPVLLVLFRHPSLYPRLQELLNLPVASNPAFARNMEGKEHS